jgi:hypothetical protein
MYVNANGVSDKKDDANPPDPVEVKMARIFIEECCVELKNIKSRGGSSSYGWKHIAEHWFQDGKEGASRRPTGAPPYISNGAFIAAAIALEYKTKRLPGAASLNVFFNMSLSREAKKRLKQ